MICGRPATVLCAVGVLLSSPLPGSAQQAAAPGQPPPAVLIAPAEQSPVAILAPALQPPQPTPKPATRRPAGPPPPAAQTPRAPETRIASQGFSVVLVIADLGAASGQSDVPPAAQRALDDVKDFLPYKSYRLLDAAWVLGQGSQSIRLRGPEDQQYELRLGTSRYATDTGRIEVHFLLREARDADEAQEVAAVRQTIEIAESTREAARLREELAAARQKQDEQKVQELERRARELERQMAARRRTTPTVYTKGSPQRPIIETSFSMNVGETVVVGTSRLKANSQALIALLTAVPPRGTTPPKSSR